MLRNWLLPCIAIIGGCCRSLFRGIVRPDDKPPSWGGFPREITRASTGGAVMVILNTEYIGVADAPKVLNVSEEWLLDYILEGQLSI